VEDSPPVVEVLLAEWDVEAVGVAGGLEVSSCGAFSEHLLDRVAGDEVNEQKDSRDDQPNDRERVEDALEESSQLSGLRSQVLGLRS